MEVKSQEGLAPEVLIFPRSLRSLRGRSNLFWNALRTDFYAASLPTVHPGVRLRHGHVVLDPLDGLRGDFRVQVGHCHFSAVWGRLGTGGLRTLLHSRHVGVDSRWVAFCFLARAYVASTCTRFEKFEARAVASSMFFLREGSFNICCCMGSRVDNEPGYSPMP